MKERKAVWFGVLVTVCALGGYLLGQGERNPRVVLSTGPESFTTRVVASGFESPWEVVWGPDGFLWITERVGKRVTRVDPNGSRHVAVTINEVEQSRGQDGLMGMALHPDLLRGTGNDFVFVAYTYDADPGPAVDLRAKIRRYVFDCGTMTLGSSVYIVVILPTGRFD